MLLRLRHPPRPLQQPLGCRRLFPRRRHRWTHFQVNGVRVTIEGERRETEMEVGLRDVANEQYALRVQEELQLGGEAQPTEEMIASLLKHASDPNGQQAPLALHGEPLDRDAALALALDLAQKTAWRYNTSDGGIAARRTTLVRILHCPLVRADLMAGFSE